MLMFRNILEPIKYILIKCIEVLKYSTFSVLDPILELIVELSKVQATFYKKLKSDLKLNEKKIRKLSFILYYLFILLIIVFFSYSIVFQGIVYPLSKLSLFLISIGTLLLCVAFVLILSSEFKRRIEKYISYAVFLVIVPLFFINWIATIENHIIYLDKLSASEWISIFEIFTTYFSACFIALVLGYKSVDK